MPDSLPMPFPVDPILRRDPVSIAGEISPLMLSHDLLNLAQEADRAGLLVSARRLLELAHSVCDDHPMARA